MVKLSEAIDATRASFLLDCRQRDRHLDCVVRAEHFNGEALRQEAQIPHTAQSGYILQCFFPHNQLHNLNYLLQNKGAASLWDRQYSGLVFQGLPLVCWPLPHRDLGECGRQNSSSWHFLNGTHSNCDSVHSAPLQISTKCNTLLLNF